MATKRPKDCPLFMHRNGQWCKKFKGRFVYFGKELDAALLRYAQEKDHWAAGLTPPRVDHHATLAELANLYLADCRQRMASGKRSGTLEASAKAVIGRLISVVGKDARLHLLQPSHWQAFRENLAQPIGRGTQRCTVRSERTIGGDVMRMKVFLNWCKRSKKLGGEIDSGTALQPPEKREIKLAKSLRGNRCWKASGLLRAIGLADVHFKPVLLLAINGGLGVADIARLTRSQWRDRDGEFLHCPRHKTGEDRRIWLFPETIAAIEAARKARPKENRQKYESCLLLTKGGLPWWRVEDGSNRDLANAALRAIKEAIGCERSFYDCRRTFRTVASETCDLEAINFCMGHDTPGEGATYLQGVSDDRVKRVCQHVRSWLYAAKKSAK